MNAIRLASAGLVSLLVAAGCGGGAAKDAPETVTISGKVTFDGKPLETGSITFDSADGQSKPVGTGIENGAYSVDAPFGPKTVRISATRVTEEKDQYGELISESYIPDKYNGESELKAEVTPAGPHEFDFDLEK